MTRHLTIFGVISKADVKLSESGPKTAAVGSGKFGDPSLTHGGPPTVTIVKAPILVGNKVMLAFFVDEQVAL